MAVIKNEQAKRTIRFLLLLVFTFSQQACAQQQQSATNNTDRVLSKQNGEQNMSQLTQAIEQMDFQAIQLASQMGPAAIPELSALLQHDDSAVRTMTVMVLGGMDLSLSHELLFRALDDSDINVINAVVQQIEVHAANLSSELLVGMLDKITEPNPKSRIILLLGNRLKLEQSGPLEKYCTAEQDQIIALHCMAALAKIGAPKRREQLSAYLLSLREDIVAFNKMFELIDYIGQPWIVPSLRLLLNNKMEVQSLGDAPSGFPKTLRVCDKATPLIAKLLGVSFSFATNLHANYSDEQLAEVNLVASNYRY
jgi:hypothetical protein